MAIKAAVASSDGKVINQHFGKAESFLIFELCDGVFKYREKRSVKPCCRLGVHEDNAFDNTAKILSDCSVILVSRIGMGAADYMESLGFAIYEAPFLINPVLEKLAKECEDCGNKL